MTNKTFQQLHQRIDGLKLSVDKVEIIAELKNRLGLVRSIQLGAGVPTTQENQEQRQPEAKKSVITSDAFEKNVLEKFGLLEAEIKAMQPTFIPRVEPSITYEKVKISRVQNQLLADNMRMEYALLDTKIFPDFGEELAFRRFCAFAFFQIEDLLSFYYHKKFQGDNRKIIAHFHEIGAKIYERSTKLEDISAASKLFAFNKSHYDAFNVLNPIKLVRNKEQHRCTVQVKDWEFSVLEKKYNDLRLAEKRTAAKEQQGSYTLSIEEKDLEDNYTAIRFIRQKNHGYVRNALKTLYDQVTK